MYRLLLEEGGLTGPQMSECTSCSQGGRNRDPDLENRDGLRFLPFPRSESQSGSGS